MTPPSDNRLPFMPLFIGDFFSDPRTQSMTAAEVGALMLLRMYMWNEPGCCLPDDEELYTLMRLSKDSDNASAMRVHAFLEKRDGKVFDPELKRIRKEKNRLVKQKSRNAKKAAQTRWGKGVKGSSKRNADALQTQCNTESESESESDKEDQSFLSLSSDGASGMNGNEALLEEIRIAWNDIVASTGKPEFRSWNTARRTSVKARLKESGWKDDWRPAMEKILESRHCSGYNERNWQANIDWFLRPRTVTALLEGKYGNDLNPKGVYSGNNESPFDD